MALILIFGRPGGGKTYTAVEQFISPALKQGRRVLHNISGLKVGERFKSAPVFPRVVIDDEGEIVFEPQNSDGGIRPDSGVVPKETNSELVRGGDLVVIDEFYLVLARVNPIVAAGAAGGRRIKNRWYLDFCEFLRAHRHYGGDGRTCDVVIMTQSDHEIPPEISLIAEKTIICKPSAVFGGGVLRRLWYDGYQPQKTAKPDYALQKDAFRPQESVYSLYRSYTAPVALREGLKGFDLVRFCTRLRVRGVVFAVALCGRSPRLINAVALSGRSPHPINAVAILRTKSANFHMRRIWESPLLFIFRRFILGVV